MGVRIEWATVDYVDVVDAGKVTDSYGTTNELPALVGEGLCIEGTPEQWLALADQIRDHFGFVPGRTDLPA